MPARKFRTYPDRVVTADFDRLAAHMRPQSSRQMRVPS